MLGLLPEIGIGSIIVLVAFLMFRENDNMNMQLFWNQVEKATDEAVDYIYSKYLGSTGKVLQEHLTEEDIEEALDFIEEQAGKAAKKLKLEYKHLRKKILSRFNKKVVDNKEKK